MTCREFFEQIYIPYQLAHYNPNTYTGRIGAIRRYFLPDYGQKELDEILSPQINHVYDSMKEQHLKDNTIYGTMAALRSFFKLAREQGFCDPEHDPVSKARIVDPDL